MSSFKISVFTGTHPNQMGNVDSTLTLSWQDLADQIIKSPWAPSTFKDNRRLNVNMKSTDLFVCDIDEGCTLEAAEKIFAPYQHIIATTRNHQKEKVCGNTVKPACDRFRVLLALDKPITNDADFKATFAKVDEKFPFIDPACKDGARFFFPCITVVSVKSDGEIITAEKHISLQKEPKHAVTLSGSNHTTPQVRTPTLKVNPTVKGKLSYRTLSFITEGSNDWHIELIAALFDLKEQGYSITEATAILEKATLSFEGSLNETDHFHIKDIYEKRETKYEPRLSTSTMPVTNQIHPKKFPTITPIDIKSIWKSAEERDQEFDEDAARREYAIKNAITLINPCFNPYIKLCCGLNIFGAKTGDGKSTVSANIAYRFLLEFGGNKKILILSNEENLENVLTRIACLFLGLNWKQYFNDQLLEIEKIKVKKTSKELNKYVEVLTRQMDSIDGVIAVLEEAKRRTDVHLVLIDYLQTIYKDESNPSKNQGQVSKDLGQFLRDYCRYTPIPIVLFAQLKAIDDDTGIDFASRVSFDLTICQHAVALVEIIPQYQSLISKFVIHKDRYGSSRGKTIQMRFHRGLFVPMDDPSALEELRKKVDADHEEQVNRMRENLSRQSQQSKPSQPSRVQTEIDSKDISDFAPSDPNQLTLNQETNGEIK